MNPRSKTMEDPIAVRDSLRQDCIYLGPLLREADRQEIAASSGKPASEALLVGLENGASCKTALMKGVTGQWYPVGMFGVTPDLDAVTLGYHAGAIWYLGSDETLRARKTFMRLSRKWIEAYSAEYDMLYNWVDARNSRHIAWLKRLGFVFSEVDPNYRGSGQTFLFFTKVNINV